ncbi:MAG TPA: shikimate dehydrogenase [Jatrophihabitantaceae bacterium]|nr:shikimate dehydrogenase [Jatrophihabitantaceae bacterium]
MTERAAVLGSPVVHSLSPVLHRAAYTALGLDWTYEAIECTADELPQVLARRADWAGFSCTMPLKHAALDVAAHARATAQQVGAANTLLPAADGGWIADNTDVDGVLGALRERASGWTDAVVLGAGGTAQAVVVALARAGLSELDVLVRDPSRVVALRDTAARVGVVLRVHALDPAAAALGASLVVSTMPPGAADPLAERAWTGKQTVLDVVYDPWPTPLAAAASARGASVVSGALMLLHQAAEQVALMTGEPAPVNAMRVALRAAVRAAGV